MRINKLWNTKLMYLSQILVVACDFDFYESPQDEFTFNSNPSLEGLFCWFSVFFLAPQKSYWYTL